MKKLLGFMVMAMIVVLPMSVKAADQITYNCGDEVDSKVTCTVVGIFDEEVAELKFTITPDKGATIVKDSIKVVEGSEWSLSDVEANGAHTVTLTSPGSKGEQDLFTVTYTVPANAKEGCGFILDYNGKKYPTPSLTPEPDKPTDNKQTGTTLPYIALGVIALGAAGAYVATRNKSKMYKI